MTQPLAGQPGGPASPGGWDPRFDDPDPIAELPRKVDLHLWSTVDLAVELDRTRTKLATMQHRHAALLDLCADMASSGRTAVLIEQVRAILGET